MNDPSETHQLFLNGMGEWMILLWIFIIIILIGTGSFFVRRRNRKRGNVAFEILKERYARGEITKQEFEDKKRDIL